MAKVKRMAELTIKRLRSELSGAEKIELESWMDQSPANREFIESRMTPEVVERQLKALWTLDDRSIRRRLGL
jgi:hypothetical protein